MTTFLGFTRLKISIRDAFNKIYILKNFIPDVLEIIDPPIIVRNKKYKEIFLFGSLKVIPEVLTLLKTFIKHSIKLNSLKVINRIIEKANIVIKIEMSS